MPKIRFTKIINSQREKIFNLKTDFENFPNILPQHFKLLKIRSVRDDISVVEEHVRIAGRNLVMLTKHVIKPFELHEVFVLSGDIKGTHVIETFETVPEGTKITIDADFKVKTILKLSNSFSKEKIESSIMEITDAFTRIVQWSDDEI